MSENGFEEYSHFFEVKLDLFCGPIDLLLHLVKQRELPIEKLSLAAVASQYMDCIGAARQFDLEIAGEYLVIAATLLSIKSSILLNEPVELVLDEDGNLVNPHDELLRKLREAQIYQESAKTLGRAALLGVDVFASPSTLGDFEDPEIRFVDHDPYLLGKAFKKLLEQAGETNLYTITFDSVSIVETMMNILGALKDAGGSMEFYKLIPDMTSRASIVSSFIALLELCKRQAIKVRQDDNFKEIMIALASADVQVSELSSEFDDSGNGGASSASNA